MDTSLRDARRWIERARERGCAAQHAAWRERRRDTALITAFSVRLAGDSVLERAELQYDLHAFDLDHHGLQAVWPDAAGGGRALGCKAARLGLICSGSFYGRDKLPGAPLYAAFRVLRTGDAYV